MDAEDVETISRRRAGGEQQPCQMLIGFFVQLRRIYVAGSWYTGNCVIVSQYLHIGSIYTDPYLHIAYFIQRCILLSLGKFFKALTKDYVD